MAVSNKLGVHFVGVLITRALLLEVYLRALDFWKLPCGFKGVALLEPWSQLLIHEGI